MARLLESKRLDGSKGLIFFCPGCKMYHSVVLAPGHFENGASWTWNDDMEKPTFNPSVGTFMGTDQQCHLFVRNGAIEFLSDCHHELRGQTVAMQEAE